MELVEALGGAAGAPAAAADDAGGGRCAGPEVVSSDAARIYISETLLGRRRTKHEGHRRVPMRRRFVGVPWGL